MKKFLIILEYLILAFSAGIILEEAKRRKIERSLMPFFIFIILVILKNLTLQYNIFNLSKDSPLFYFINVIDLLYMAVLLLGYMEETRRYVKTFSIISGLTLIGISSFYIFDIEFTPYYKWLIKGWVSFVLLLSTIRMNSGYFYGEERNFITANISSWNTIVGIRIFLTLFFFTNDGIFKHIMDIVWYSILFHISFEELREGFSIYERKIKRMEFEKRTLIELLSITGRELTRKPDFGSLLQLMLDYSTKVLKARAGAVFLMDKKRKYLIPKFVKGIYPPISKVEDYLLTKEKFLREKFFHEKIPVGETYLGMPAAKGEPLFIRDATEDNRIIQTAQKIFVIRSVMVLPIIIEDKVEGVISFLNKEDEVFFSEEDFALARSLAEQIAVTLNNFRLYNELLEKQRTERDIELAGEIQRQLLPKEPPRIEGLDIYGFSKPAKGVGGDYFDFLPFEKEKRIGVIMADVAGKGVPAALVMVMIRSIIHTIASGNVPPGKIITFMNKRLVGEVTQERYATMFYFMVDIPTRYILFTNAGHLPALWLKAESGEVEQLDTPGFPVGIVSEYQYNYDKRKLNKGDIIFLYTDGISEAKNMKREEFTTKRIIEILKENYEKSAAEIGEIVKTNIDKFVGEAEQHDDQTLVIIKVL